MYHVSSCRNSHKNDKISQESIPFEKLALIELDQMDTNIKNLTVLSCIKLTCLQINPETEVACKYPKPLFKTQNSEFLVKYEKDFHMKTGKTIIVHSTTISKPER